TAPGRTNADAAAAPRTAASQSTPQPQQQAAGNTAPLIAFHLAQARPAEGLARVAVNPGTSLYAVPQPVFTQADLQQVVPVQAKNGQVFLRFDFNQQGAAKLAKVTREALGNYLIISVRSQVVAVPNIGAAYEGGTFPVPLNSVDEAQSIVKMLRQPAG
ncbi:SecDF P1 head subdomain-containing protein, partial [Bordetella petrii]|uniref:SecDF P1 head subdomain-containing protein n=1 Tax=Bordetella petrii TaxID=94624 RepID=UPI001E6259AA